MVLREQDVRRQGKLAGRSGIGWLLPLISLTLANYAWQLPYGVHQHGARWLSTPTRFALPLLALCWFGSGIWLHRTNRRGAGPVLAGYLVAEVSFYLLHNAAGTFLAGALLADPVDLVASVLGYLNTIVAVCYLIALLHRGSSVAGNPSSTGGQQPDRPFRSVADPARVSTHAGR